MLLIEEKLFWVVGIHIKCLVPWSQIERPWVRLALVSHRRQKSELAAERVCLTHCEDQMVWGWINTKHSKSQIIHKDLPVNTGVGSTCTTTMNYRHPLKGSLDANVFASVYIMNGTPYVTCVPCYKDHENRQWKKKNTLIVTVSVVVHWTVVYLGEGTEPSSSSNRVSTVDRPSSNCMPFLLGFSRGRGLTMISGVLPFS